MHRGRIAILILIAGAIGWATARFTSPAITPPSAIESQNAPTLAGKSSVASAETSSIPTIALAEPGLTHAYITMGNRPGTLTVSTLSTGRTSPTLPQRNTSVASPLIALSPAQLTNPQPQPAEDRRLYSADEQIKVSFSGLRNGSEVALTLARTFDPADLDQSGNVDTEDLRELVSRIEVGDDGGDLNADGQVDGGDLELLLGRLTGERSTFAVY